jgi:hypothetical protein
MEYSSPMNDREHLDKTKSQIGFYEGVCLPLFEELVTFDARLASALGQVRANLEIWKRREEGGQVSDAMLHQTHSSERAASPRREKKKSDF